MTSLEHRCRGHWHAAWALALLGAGCDVGGPQNRSGEGGAIRIVDSNVVDGVLGAAEPLEIRTSRPLHFATISRQSVELMEGATRSSLVTTVGYDPVNKLLRIAPLARQPDGRGPVGRLPSDGQAAGEGGPSAGAWPLGASFRVVLRSSVEAPLGGSPTGTSDSTGLAPQDTAAATGLRAIDGASVEDSSGEPAVSFTVVETVEGRPPPAPAPVVDYCAHIAPILARSCVASAGGCHSPRQVPAAMGLDLSNGAAISRTARGKVARHTLRGGRASEASANPRAFGRDMEIVAPGNAAASWLLYAALGAEGSPWSDDDRAALADRMQNRAMPPPGSVPLAPGEYDLLREWIDGGADTAECNKAANAVRSSGRWPSDLLQPPP